jgi:hypothetical protein
MRVLAVEHDDERGSPSRSWSVEPASGSGSDSGEWRLSGGSESDVLIPVTVPTREAALLRIEYDALDFLVRTHRSSAAVHAALLSKEDRGVVIVGPSFAGKSTLATALWRAGWSLMSDDIVFMDASKRSVSPAPRRVSLRFESRELIGEELWSEIAGTPSCIRTWKGLYFHPHEVSKRERRREAPLSAIFFLARRDVSVAPAEAREINPAKAAVALIPYAINIRNLPFIESLRQISPLLSHAPAYDLGRGPLRAMVEEVEACVA